MSENLCTVNRAAIRGVRGLVLYGARLAKGPGGGPPSSTLGPAANFNCMHIVHIVDIHVHNYHCKPQACGLQEVRKLRSKDGS